MDAIKLTADNVRKGQDRDGELVISFRVKKADYWKALRLLDECRELPAVELTAREPKKVRSLDQNAYFWALAGQIAQKVRADNREVYKALLEAYTPPMWMVFPAAAEELMLKEPFRVIHKEAEQDGKITALCWRSNKYLDTAEFSALLDGTLEEARQVGIDPEAVKLGLMEARNY